MQLTTIIDVALGLILLYLVLSLICTTINEFIAAFIGLRARNLASTIEQLIDSKSFRDVFYAHGLIVSSALASRAGGVTKIADSAHVSDGTTATSIDVPRPTYLDGKTVARAVLDSLDPSKPLVLMEDVKASIAKLPENSVIRAALLANVNVAGESVEAFREGVANWFDSAMDRLSGRYNRQLKLISLLIGLALAGALNADSLGIARAIWTDHDLQRQMETASDGFIKANTDLMTNCSTASAEPAKQIECGADRLTALEAQLRPFPLGWSGDWSPTDLGWVLQKLLGIAWTAIALSLGAPFWFDLLQKIMSLRAAGGKPASSTEAADPEPTKKVAVVPDQAPPPARSWLAATKRGR